MRRLTFIAMAIVVSGLAGVVATSGLVHVGRVSACSAVVGPLDQYARYVDVVVVVQVLSAGGPGNTAPAVTPTPVGTPAPFVPPTPQGKPSQAERAVDLTGIGARVQLVELVGGEVPMVEVEVDTSRRRGVEELNRKAEADPNFQYPCAFDFAVHRFKAGETFLLFLTRDRDGGLVVEARMRVEAENVVVGGPGELVGEIEMSGSVYATYFADIAATKREEQFEDNNRFPDDALWTLVSRTAPLGRVTTAIKGIRSGDVYKGLARPVAVKPPDTGTGGLR